MLRSKIKPTGGEAPRDHGTQIGANGSSQNDFNRLPVKFQVNRTSNADFFRGIKLINEEKCQGKYRRKKKQKSPKNCQETATEKGAKASWSPATLAHGLRQPRPKVAGPMVSGNHGCMVAGDHGCMVAGDPGSLGRRISTETTIFPILSAFRDVWPL
ncbi:hypothetical protein AAC387_Pa06g1798 [Persea americana]